MKYLIATLILLTGCSSQEQKEHTQSWVQSWVQTIMYAKDTRPEPDICYAITHSRLATVPCASVKHLLR